MLSERASCDSVFGPRATSWRILNERSTEVTDTVDRVFPIVAPVYSFLICGKRHGSSSTPDLRQTRLVEPGDTVVITGLTWTTGRPQVRLRRNGAPSSLYPLDHLALRYSAGRDSTRWCIGHKPFRDSGVPWTDCDRPPLHHGRTCDRCAASDATFASQLHHAHNKGHSELDSAVRTHLEQPNSLYLAAFRDGSIKVGTSTAARLPTRLEEQGAWAAQVVAAATDGFAVRTLEDRITVELGLSQSVSVRRKLAGLLQPVSDDHLRAELSRWTVTVHSLMARLDDSRTTPSSTGWVSSISTDPIWARVHPYPLKLHSGNHDVEFIAASGRVTVLGRPGSSDRFLADLRTLYGIELRIADVEPDELAVQDSLF
ncbi:MAG: hypothetical protein ACI81L_001324 [Verrucomicrobiales bacterium]|jgi:hypothetical protein